MSPKSPFPYRPLPGTEAPIRGLFVDRWGTLLASANSEPTLEFAETCFVAGAVDALHRAVLEGWKVYLIGNEDEVALGRASDERWLAFERRLLAELAGGGVRVERNYACLEHPEGAGSHRKPSVFRLPDTGLFYHALQADGIALQQSWVIGDSTLEIAAGSRVGCKTAAVRTGEGMRDAELAIEPDVRLDDLPSVVDLLLQSPAYARPR